MKKLLTTIAIFSFFIFITPTVSAAGLGISASSKTVTEGGSVTITVNASGLIGRFSITSSNGNVLSGGTSSDWIENGSQSYRFTAKSVGTATITVNSIDVSSTSGQKYTESKSITINVVKPREKSNNNYLSSLSIEGYSINPEFSKDQLEYSLEVPAETEKIQIHASKEDDYASVDGIGEKEVSEGDNHFEIKVTSETGKERIYVINVNVKDNNPIQVEIDGIKYTVVKKASSLQKPEFFEEKMVEIDGIEVPGFYNETSDLTLIGLRSPEGQISLYIYHEKEKTYTKYQPLTSASISIISLPNIEGFKNHSKVIVKIEDEEYEGYQISEKSNFIYLYGKQIENGKESWYIYDKEEKTIQRYQQEEADKIEKEYQKKLKEQKLVIACLAGISLFLSLMILILAFSKKKKRKQRKEKKEAIIDSIVKDQDTEKKDKIGKNKVLEEDDFLGNLSLEEKESEKDEKIEEKEISKKKKERKK